MDNISISIQADGLLLVKAGGFDGYYTATQVTEAFETGPRTVAEFWQALEPTAAAHESL